ncbi:MAG: carbohydrate ABC transporter permease [Propionibacteriaceae bacterium]|nr:carbohydrate ABC transporter permease [Propionibacteriaceae bacterium]
MTQSTLTPPPPVTRKRGRSKGSPAERGDKSVLRTIGIVIVWISVALGVLLLGWVILQSLRDTRSILGQPFGLPDALRWDNYARAWTGGNFGVAAWNSLTVTVISSVLTIVVAAPAAYFLGRVETPLTEGLTFYFILGLGIPAQVILIPLFIMLNSVYLTDSLIGLNLVYIGVSMPFTVFLLVGFFRSLPVEVEEAAALDGASPWGTMWRIAMPLAKGGLLTAFILQVISHWNETLLALTLLQSTEKYTLPVALISFIQQQTYSGADWGGEFAGIVLIVLPMLALYLWVGSKLSAGLTVGIGK